MSLYMYRMFCWGAPSQIYAHTCQGMRYRRWPITREMSAYLFAQIDDAVGTTRRLPFSGRRVVGGPSEYSYDTSYSVLLHQILISIFWLCNAQPQLTVSRPIHISGYIAEGLSSSYRVGVVV